MNPNPMPPLSEYSDDKLLEELRRRGRIGTLAAARTLNQDELIAVSKDDQRAKAGEFYIRLTLADTIKEFLLQEGLLTLSKDAADPKHPYAEVWKMSLTVLKPKVETTFDADDEFH